ncbi:hypothetical protein N665_0525s0011 [Sinapis alba]|nr:hypothetical protein N665_0525s0011 [Sinapis alba]
MSDLPPEKPNMELSSSSSMPGSSSSLHHSYSRKQKSLGVERRRIYDIVNVLESVDGSDDEDDEEESSQPFSSSQTDTSKPASLPYSSKIDNRREKSLGLLTQNFIKLFICSQIITVRRLYDIANVLSSMDLIEKTHTLDSRKPSFKWLGYNGEPTFTLSSDLMQAESKKRVFGTDLSNVSVKRRKTHDNATERSLKMKQHAIEESSYNKIFDAHESRGYEFGPFAPATGTYPTAPLEDNSKRAFDVENLVSDYRPSYQNQVLKDLFGHYMDAWKSWYREVTQKNPLPDTSQHH